MHPPQVVGDRAVGMGDAVDRAAHGASAPELGRDLLERARQRQGEPPFPAGVPDPQGDRPRDQRGEAGEHRHPRDQCGGERGDRERGGEPQPDRRLGVGVEIGVVQSARQRHPEARRKSPLRARGEPTHTRAGLRASRRPDEQHAHERCRERQCERQHRNQLGSSGTASGRRAPLDWARSPGAALLLPTRTGAGRARRRRPPRRSPRHGAGHRAAARRTPPRRRWRSPAPAPRRAGAPRRRAVPASRGVTARRPHRSHGWWTSNRRDRC